MENIILIHKWRQEYVKYAIKQIIKTNPNTNIILLTDDKILSENFFGEKIIYENICDFFEFASEFKKIYIHMSYTWYEYELFCMQRWLIIYEYLMKKWLKDCFHFDSDVLVFSNLTEYKNNIKKYDFCYTWSCWHCFFSKLKWLEFFKNFVFQIYQNPEGIELLKKYHTGELHSIIYRNNWAFYEDKTKSVTDMILFYLFINSDKNIKFHDLWKIENDEVFDNVIWFGEWFDTKCGIKKLKLEDWNIYWFIKDKRIKFNTVHFQWENKRLMEFYYNKSFWLKYIKALTPYCIKRNFIDKTAFVLQKIWLYEMVRETYLNMFKRKWKK